jgi:hypothetical protein
MRRASSLRLRNCEDGVAQFWHWRVTSGLSVFLDGRVHSAHQVLRHVVNATTGPRSRRRGTQLPLQWCDIHCWRIVGAGATLRVKGSAEPHPLSTGREPPAPQTATWQPHDSTRICGLMGNTWCVGPTAAEPISRTSSTANTTPSTGRRETGLSATNITSVSPLKVRQCMYGAIGHRLALGARSP